MRIALLVGLVIATASCEGYQFPGPEGGTGTVHGQVIALACGGGPCLACPIVNDSGARPCGAPLPISGFELDFNNGDASRVTKTDSAGAYSIDLSAGTWQVKAGNYGRIVEGPQSVAVSAGGSFEADYTVDTGIRPAA
jgi:hypothetical protein